MNGLSDGWSNSACVSTMSAAATMLRSSTWSPIRTPTRGCSPGAREDAEGEVVDVEAGPGGAGDPGLGGRGHACLRRVGGDESEGDQVVEGLGHRAGAERGEPAARRGEVGRRRASAPSRCSSASVASATEPPSHRAWVAAITLRKPCAPPPSGSWRTARCRPAVALNGVSRSRAASIHAATVRRVGDQVVVDVAEAELEPVAGCGDLVGGREPGGRGGAGDLDEDGYVVVEGAVAPGLVDRGDHPADVAGEVVGVAQRDLEARDGQADPLRRAPAGRPPAPAPPVTTTDSGAPKPRTSGTSVSLQDEAADQVGVPLGARGRSRPRWPRGSVRRRAGRSPRRRRGRATAPATDWDRGMQDRWATGLL